jgi:hypothetical protein
MRMREGAMKKVCTLAVVIVLLVVDRAGREKKTMRDRAVLAWATAVNGDCADSLASLTNKSVANISASSSAEYLAEVHSTLSSFKTVCKDPSELISQAVTTHKVALLKLAMLRRIAGVLDAKAKTLQIMLQTAQ